MPRLLLALCLFLLPLTTAAQNLPSIAEKTDGLAHRDGFLPVYWDAAKGTIWLEIPQLEEDLLYVESLPAGLGSNDVGLDRGQLGGEQVVRFERVGPKVLLVAPNLRYRASTDNPAEQRAVEDAFAESVLWGFEVAAETDGRVLVDATDFVVRDAHGVVQRLKQTDQGTFVLDRDRSAPVPSMLKAFPRNTELEARLTFTSDAPGRYVRQTAADPTSVTLRQRHSFVRLPPPGFEPRPFDPRSGYFAVTYRDYAVPIGEDVTQRVIMRHRLQCAAGRTEPQDGLCTPAEPIVYYLDPGTPEPVRSALLDGARWWSEAFEAAGFRDAFRVEMLPEDADPLDVRYDVIQWVHRATRGWSYGASVVDPRTGEIIKGHVTLGSLRVRQDYLLAEGLLSPYEGEHAAGFPAADDPLLVMALARIRQLAAHEVGHTLGLAHNFAASPDGRASVMDYPAPLATITDDGTLSLEDAYDSGIGEWDVFTIRYGYAPAPQDAEPFLEAVLREARANGLAYLSDADARPGGAAHPAANLWDNGADMIESLEREMRVRAVALGNFDASAIRTGRPMALLEEALVPLYLRHRYQVEATTKLLGGVTYTYALRGDDQAAPAPVDGATQRAALEALLEAVTPEALGLPAAMRSLIPPRPPGYPDNRELFDARTGLTFDPYAPAETATRLVLAGLVHPERAARLAYQHDFDPSLPGLFDVLNRVTAQTWQQPTLTDAYDAALQRVVQTVWTDVLLETAARDDLAPAVAAAFTYHLRTLRDWLAAQPGGTLATAAHRTHAADRITRFLERPATEAPASEPLTAPPGSPIGHTP